MSCCGQKRLHWQQKPANAQPVKSSHEPVLLNTVAVKYTGKSIHVMKGSQTGLMYVFAAEEPGLMVDSRDVPSMLADSQKFSLL